MPHIFARPELSNCSSYYRLRDLNSGEIVCNLTTPVVDSCDHSFGSAFVDVLKDGTEVLWVFGSAWYRPMLAPAAAAVGSSTRGGGGLQRRLDDRGGSGWTGECGKGGGINCTIGSFRTTDPTFQTWTKGVALKPGRASWNMDVSYGKPTPAGGKTYVMAIEQQPLPGAPAGSSWTTYFYVKDGDGAADGDLTSGWRLLPTKTHVIGGSGTHGACPTIRYLPDDQGGMYYVISGGLSVYLDRSANLSTWMPSKTKGITLQASQEDVKVCTEYVG